MARYDSAHKERTRNRILDSAGRLFRTEGYAASGVAKVMGDSDLTVGGFYAHFPSKAALLAEVLARSLGLTQDVLLAGLEGVDGVPFIQEIARRYLSREHRDAVESGCALPSLAAEVFRQSDETRQVFEDYFERLLDAFEPRMPPPHEKLTRRDRATALAALLVGGLIFARAVRTSSLSDRILLACKRFALSEVSR